jgi:hypothetical protein
MTLSKHTYLQPIVSTEYHLHPTDWTAETLASKLQTPVNNPKEIVRPKHILILYITATEILLNQVIWDMKLLRLSEPITLNLIHLPH